MFVTFLVSLFCTPYAIYQCTCILLQFMLVVDDGVVDIKREKLNVF